MAYYPNKTNISTYSKEYIAFEVGKESKDTYCIMAIARHNIETGEINTQYTVLKNDSYSKKPTDPSLIKENQKYEEELLKGSAKECLDFIVDIVTKEGYWDQDPNDGFKKVFIEPIK